MCAVSSKQLLHNFYQKISFGHYILVIFKILWHLDQQYSDMDKNLIHDRQMIDWLFETTSRTHLLILSKVKAKACSPCREGSVLTNHVNRSYFPVIVHCCTIHTVKADSSVVHIVILTDTVACPILVPSSSVTHTLIPLKYLSNAALRDYYPRQAKHWNRYRNQLLPR